MNGRSSKAAGVTKFRLKRVKSDTNGRIQNARYGISTSASTPLTPNSTAPSISYISGHMILGAEINGEFVYHLGDALSTVRDVVDDEGDVIRSFEFDEYGNLLNSSGSGATSPKTWIGGLSVNDDRADSGLWNMGHRNYAGGVLGRFISRDPIGLAGSLNLYSYGANSPVGFVDPEGFAPIAPPTPTAVITQIYNESGGATTTSNGNTLTSAAAQRALTALSTAPQSRLVTALVFLLAEPAGEEQDWQPPDCEGDPRGKGKWTCRAKCTVYTIPEGGPTGTAWGVGHGPSRSIAAANAISSAQNSTPRGYRTKHCRVTNCVKK